MFPNLFQATQEYWRKLDDLEARYQNNEISIQEVNAEVKRLMAELGEERRRSLRFTADVLQNWLVTQKESLVGISAIALVCYGWLLVAQST
ncbi:hypothetical protein [[Limnothrix rosea] IAM M-220]|uniref:hypothetical protein n=1 Tax=[Limnothrix rosea] IAM M-220 TaxID=454133 RepID=UPI00095E1A1C|nr:hypothetical protein [[Limnothrix rosea] IAM M-220]OKH17424.1 hypothetical protein NIES208_09410 [[Limnothrix rosea] IAM M-220]